MSRLDRILAYPANGKNMAVVQILFNQVLVGGSGRCHDAEFWSISHGDASGFSDGGPAQAQQSWEPRGPS